MCSVYSKQDPYGYESVSRSVRLSGVVTSVRLERTYWSIVDEIAAAEGMSTGKFLSTVYSEAVNENGAVINFASLLRVSCLTHVSRRSPAHNRYPEVAEGAVA